MCGRYLLKQPFVARDFFGKPFDEFSEKAIKPRFNIAPTQRIPVVTGMDKGIEMRWGLVPAWAKGSQILINARRETIREKRSFKKSFAERRCLVPADGFYEWTKATKRPHLFTVGDGEPFAIGAFWDEQRDGEEMPRCCLLTTEANAVLEPIHDRMPVIVRKVDWEQWMEPGELADADFQRLTAPYDAAVMRAVEVSKTVNSAKTDGPECAQPLPPTLGL